MHLLYTQPDLAFHVSKLSQYNSNPSTDHMRAAKHVLRYLQGTLDLGILYTADSTDLWPVGFSDASFATDLDDSKSHSGYVFTMSNGVISHSSKKQSCIAQSSMEAEYYEMSEAAKEVMFLRNILDFLNFKLDRPIVINTDAKSAYDHVKNNVNHSRTKHFQRRHHFIRQAYQTGEVDIERVPAKIQTADILTKPLDRQLHERGVKLLGMVSKPAAAVS